VADRGNRQRKIRRPSAPGSDGTARRKRAGGDAAEGGFDASRGVFMISVAAELAGMHPQTLRMYEARGLIKPSRSPKQTRLYSQRDVERLRRIQELTSELGLNLAGVERVLAMEEKMRSMREELARLEDQAEEARRKMLEQIDAIHRSYRRELVLWEPPGEILRMKHARPLKVAVERKANRRQGDDPGRSMR
jgi:MerR family transcriptional regulator/heat shock protein HspR